MNDQWLMSLDAAKSALEASSDTTLRTPCYCEENVWRLAYRKINQEQARGTNNCSYHVAFVSNPKACVPMFEQLAADDRATPVMWDYHVILFRTTTTPEDSIAPKTYVMDIDSHLPYPCPFEDYIEMVFPNHTEWVKECLPYFRVIDAPVFLRHFSSDRSHMYNAKTKTWNAPPPSYDCILPPKVSENNENANGTNTLKQFMIISHQNVVDSQQQSENSPLGRIYSLSQFLQRFSAKIEDQISNNNR